MSQSQFPEYTNQNYITDNDEDDTRPTKPPKKQLKAAFDLVHPVTEEMTLKELEARKTLEEQLEKTRKERNDIYAYAFYGASVLLLLFFSHKSWFPILRSSFL